MFLFKPFANRFDWVCAMEKGFCGGSFCRVALSCQLFQHNSAKLSISLMGFESSMFPWLDFLVTAIPEILRSIAVGYVTWFPLVSRDQLIFHPQVDDPPRAGHRQLSWLYPRLSSMSKCPNHPQPWSLIVAQAQVIPKPCNSTAHHDAVSAVFLSS